MLSVFCSRDRSRAVHGIVINGSRDSKYDLHRLVYFRCTPESVTIVDPNPVCIFILFLGDRRAIFFCFLLRFPIDTVIFGVVLIGGAIVRPR